MERGTMPMSKNKKILLMLAKGGATQSDIAAALHVSKRDVSAGAKVMRECGLTFDAVSSMDADAVDDMFFAKEERRPNDAYLRPDMAALVERKKMSRKLPVKLFWLEYCERAAAEGKLAYAYQTFCEMFADAAGKMGATRHFSHEPGAKCFIDWAGRRRPPHRQAAGNQDQGLRPGRHVALLGQVLGGGLLRHEAEILAGGPDPRVRGVRRRSAHVGARQRRHGDRSGRSPAGHAREQGVRALRRALRGGRPARPGPSAARQERGRIVRRPG